MRYGHFDDAAREYVIDAPGHAAAVDQLPRQRGLTSGSSPTRPAATRSTATPACAASPATATTTRRSTWAAATSTCATTTAATTGPRWQPTQRDLDEYALPARPGLHDHRSTPRAASSAETLYFVPLGETLEVWRTRITNDRRRRRSCRSSARSSSASGTPRTTPPTSSATSRSGEVEVEDGVIYHKTEYRERRDHFAYFACSEPLGGLRHAARRVPRAVPRLGPAARRRARARLATRSRTAGSRSARTTCGSSSRRARRARSSSCSATRRTRRTRSSTRPARRPSTSSRSRPVIDALAAAGEVDAAFDSLREHWDGLLGSLQVRDRQRAHRPDGQHLERLSVHGHVQPVPLGVALRVRHRARHGLPRLEPGPARLRAHDPGARPRADPRHRGDPARRPAARITSTSR